MSSAISGRMPTSLVYPRVAFDAVLAGAAKAYPDRIALRDGDTTVTFAQLYDYARRIAGGLRALGVKQGDMVALQMPNSIWFPISYFSLLCAGATACPVNNLQPAGALQEQFDDFGVTAVITHPASCSVLASIDAADINLVVMAPATTAGPAPEEYTAPIGSVDLTDLLASVPLADEPVDPDSVAHLQLTGGTTGKSKGVRVLHRNLVANVIQMAISRGDCIVPVLDGHGGLQMELAPGAEFKYSEGLGKGLTILVAPYFHGAGLVGQCSQVLTGTTVVIEGRFNAEQYLSDIDRFQATRMSGSPAFLNPLLNSPSLAERSLASVRAITCGAAPIDDTLMTRLVDAFPNAEVMEIYGLSEATCVVAAQPLPSIAFSPAGSAGVPLIDTKIEIRNERGVHEVATGEEGEIWVHGPQVSDGYHRHPELTAEQIVDGWLRTGDVGRVDEKGNVFLVGRAKDMIIYKGYNVYPAHLESLLNAHEEVIESSVIGVPSEAVGEYPMAFVTLRNPERASSTLSEELMTYVSERVVPYQKVREVRFIDALPLTATGKILKRSLRDLL